MARIELDIFSGRPNPGWDLDAAQEAELGRRLARLSPPVERVSVPSLGYRGFLVHDGSELRIYGGHVVQDSDARALQSIAGNRAIERWLLETGKRKLDASIYTWALQQIGNE